MSSRTVSLGGFANAVISIDKELDVLIQNVSPGSPLRDKALRDASEVVVKAMQEKITDAKHIIKRYKNGKVIATYHPGNLRRAIGVLDLKDTVNVFAGVKIPPRGKARGNFKGNRVDGYYATFVEIKKPFIRPAFDSTAGQMKAIIRDGLLKALTG